MLAPTVARLVSLVAVPLAAFAAGCGSADDAPTETVAPSALAGKSFVSTSVDGHELVEGTRLQLTFADDRLTYSGGCNQQLAPWQLADGTLQITADPAGTLMACEPALEAQDQWFTQQLGEGLDVSNGDDGRLTLTHGDVRITFEEHAPPGLPSIERTLWTLDHITDRDGHATPVPAGAQAPTLQIQDGHATVFGGCNNGSGAATVGDDGFITFGPLGMTMMACEEPASTLERAMTTMLEGKVAAGFTGEGDLSLGRGGQFLVFTASGG
jgi:heat shock protein HslJ